MEQLTGEKLLKEKARQSLIQKYGKQNYSDLDDKTNLRIIYRLLKLDINDNLKTYRLKCYVLNWLNVEQILSL